jgi:undecaprenyl-diphosphatase
MASVKDFDELSTTAILSLPPSVAPLMDKLSLIGEPSVVLTVGAAGFISAVVRSQSAEQTAFVLSALAFSIGTLLKLTLKRRRPHGRVVRNFGINSYSFPSGHAFGTVIFYGLFAVINARYLSAAWTILFSILVAALIFLIGLSRVYKGAPFPSDVLAGWLLCCVSLVIVNWLAF